MSASALAITLSPAPALAHDDAAPGPRADDHAPAGVMGDHVHQQGEVMIGLRLMRDRSAGPNIAGDDRIGDAAIAAAGYAMRTQSMTMDMAMLDIMYAPTDRVTLMVMPQYMRMDMEMAATGGMAMGHGGHGAATGMAHRHRVEGWGDTQVAALYSMVDRPALRLHATLGVSIPTGAVDRTNPDGTFVHYGMQPGSGTWDVLPAVTVRGGRKAVRWGAQASYVWRTSDHNASGFAFGDRFAVTGWTSYALMPELSASLRGEFEQQGSVLGHYNGPHNHSAPSDRQANYGGKSAAIGFGVNFVPRYGVLTGLRLGSEVMVPVWQHANGIQAPQRWGLNLSLSKAF